MVCMWLYLAIVIMGLNIHRSVAKFLMLAKFLLSPGGECLKAYTRGKLDASKRTELVLNSSWHFTGSQVHVIGIPEKRDQVQCLLDPLCPAHVTSPCAHLTSRAERG